MEAQSEETVPLQSVTLEKQTLEEMIQSGDENADQRKEGDLNKSLTTVEEGMAGAGQKQAPKTPAADGSAKLPSWNKFKTLVVFLLFRVILPSCDVITDIVTGISLCQRGHFRWGFATLVLIFCPFLAGLVQYFVKEKWPNYFRDRGSSVVKEAVWLLPLVQPFV